MKLKLSKLYIAAVIGFSFLKTNPVSGQCVLGTEFNKATPKMEVRGVFLPSIFSLNWPTNRTATPAVQQAELITILDNLKANGYNTVYLQVRPESDALYNSAIEPWSYWLTGTQGKEPNPLWDPLTFAVTESHKRGLDLHAWLNPYRAQNGTYATASNHVLNTHPSWVFVAANSANLKLLNPGIPAVRDYIVSIVQDIATRYDVDGIHFDDYFYPSGGMAVAPNNQDKQTFIDYNPNNISTLEDWRRDNVNLMIGMVYDAIQTINTNLNKNVVFGVSPAGIWKSGTPSGITGNSSYSALYCDPIAWLNNGKVDYLAPQLYWVIGGSQDYIKLSQWWNDQVKAKSSQLYISQAYYRMEDSSNWVGSEIQNQINQDRSTTMDATFGHIAYSYTAIKNNAKTINTLLKSNQFLYKSFAPPIAGKDAICPEKPENIRFGALKIMWDTPVAASDGDLPVKYVVYAFANPAEAITNKNDGSKILDIVVGNELDLDVTTMNSKFFVVTSLDKNNNEAGDFGATLANPYFDFQDTKSFYVYPNPFNDYFEIEFPGLIYEDATISIFDGTGKQVWEQNIMIAENSKTRIEPQNLASGIYYAKITFEDGSSESFKIIKQ